MSYRKRISANSSASVEDEFKRFLLSKKAKGLADKTLTTYQQQFSAIAKHLEIVQCIEKLCLFVTMGCITSHRAERMNLKYNFRVHLSAAES